MILFINSLQFYLSTLLILLKLLLLMPIIMFFTSRTFLWIFFNFSWTFCVSHFEDSICFLAFLNILDIVTLYSLSGFLWLEILQGGVLTPLFTVSADLPMVEYFLRCSALSDWMLIFGSMEAFTVHSELSWESIASGQIMLTSQLVDP